MKYVVVKKHSHTDKQCLWKVMSRSIESRTDADSELDWYKKTDPKNASSYFLVAEIV